MASKVVIITGASSGTGAALAKQLAARGDKVVLAARRETELKAVARDSGADALAVITDVIRRSDMEQLRDAAIGKFGHIDVWINNAGRGIVRHVLDLTDDDVDQMLAVNFTSALYGMQVVVPHFKERKSGHVINMSAVLAHLPVATFRSIYCASKAALNTLTANLRMDLRAEYPNIHISVVMPPVVMTDFHKNALYGTPSGKIGGAITQTAEQVATAIVGLIDQPRAELYTGPGQAEVIARYYADVEAFEENLAKR